MVEMSAQKGASQILPALVAQQKQHTLLKLNSCQLLNIGLFNPAFDLTPQPPEKSGQALSKREGSLTLKICSHFLMVVNKLTMVYI